MLLVKLKEGTSITSVLVEIEKKQITDKQLRTTFKPNAEEKEKLYTLEFSDDEDIASLAKRVGEMVGVKKAP